MTENVSDRNGRALEYIIAIELEKLRGFTLTSQTRLLNGRDKDKFLSLPSSLKSHYQDAALKISKWAETLFSSNANVTVDRLNDNPDDPSDFILLSNNSRVSISLKHNHEALKHPRPYSFAQACGYQKNSPEDISHRNRMNLGSNYFRNASKGKLHFNQCSPSSIEKLYFDVCKSCEDSISTWKTTNKNLASILFDFLVSSGYYKIIVDTRNGTQVKVQNFLNIPQPSSLTTSVKGNRLLLEFNNGWAINLRIHTASSKIASAPSQLSLKFDAQKEVGAVREFLI